MFFFFVHSFFMMQIIFFIYTCTNVYVAVYIFEGVEWILDFFFNFFICWLCLFEQYQEWLTRRKQRITKVINIRFIRLTALWRKFIFQLNLKGRFQSFLGFFLWMYMVLGLFYIYFYFAELRREIYIQNCNQSKNNFKKNQLRFRTNEFVSFHVFCFKFNDL